jgi:Ca2+-binding EF-hand superfamily protein
MTLQKVFNDFDKQKDGKLSENEFFKMMNKLDKTMPQDEIMEAFNLIDEDGSKTIEFDELNKYYCKVNGIPYYISAKNLPEMMDI